MQSEPRNARKATDMLERFKPKAEDRVYVREERVRAATKAIFLKMGLDDEGADQCTDVLITNDLRGVETHGVSNMLRRYVREYSDGTLNPRPQVKVLRETDTTASLDADRALGIHVAPRAMRMAIDKARKHGIGAVSVVHAGHLGGAGYHAMLAAQEGMIGHAMAGPGGSQMVPTFASIPRFGTHPIAWAAPAGKEHPFLFDIATTQIAGNKIALARRVGAKLAPAWITDEHGEPIMDEVDVPDTYYQLPFGGTRENSSHKGYGLASVVDIITNSMTGLGAGFISGGGGQYFQATNIEAFIPLNEFKDLMDQFLGGLRTAPPAKGHDRVLYPGLTEGEETEKRKRDGIPYHREVVDWFNSIGAELDVPIELP